MSTKTSERIIEMVLLVVLACIFGVSAHNEGVGATASVAFGLLVIIAGLLAMILYQLDSISKKRDE